MKLTIGITDTEAHYSNYQEWIKAGDPDIEIIKLSLGNANDLKKCVGIVLTGGIDTHPKYYGNNRIDYPLAPSNFNKQRDEFEINVFNYTQQYNMPVLAVCRGMQLVNIILGGDLIQDIEEAGKNNHRGNAEDDGIHELTVVKTGLLFEITGLEKGTVNSSHHQALGRIADDLTVSAYSSDDIAEAAEWKNKKDKPFLLCVQWHPERLVLKQPDTPFAHEIRNQFLKAVQNKSNA